MVVFFLFFSVIIFVFGVGVRKKYTWSIGKVNCFGMYLTSIVITRNFIGTLVAFFRWLWMPDLKWEVLRSHNMPYCCIGTGIFSAIWGRFRFWLFFSDRLKPQPSYLGGGFTYFFNFLFYLGKISIWLIFFRWGETTNKLPTFCLNFRYINVGKIFQCCGRHMGRKLLRNLS